MVYIMVYYGIYGIIISKDFQNMISDELTLFFETRTLDGNSSVPIYTELQKQLLHFIETHSETTEFPSERELAELLKINRRTLHKAIEPLIADGTLIRTRKKTLIIRKNKTDHQIGAYGAHQNYSAGMNRKIRLLLLNTAGDELNFWQETAEKFGELFPMLQLQIDIPGQNTGNYQQKLEQGEFDLAVMPTYINWKNTFTDHLLPVKDSYLKLFDSPEFLSGSWTASAPELRKYAIPWSLSFQIQEWNRVPEELFALDLDALLAACPGKLPEKMSLFPGYYELSRDLGVPETFTQDIIIKHCSKLLDRFDLASENDTVFQMRNPGNDALISRNSFSYDAVHAEKRYTLFQPSPGVCYWGGCGSLGINKDSSCIHEAYLFIEFLLSVPVQNTIWNKLHRAPVRIHCIKDVQEFFGMDPLPYLRQCRENPKSYPCPVGCAILPYAESYLTGAISRQEVIENVLRFYS